MRKLHIASGMGFVASMAFAASSVFASGSWAIVSFNQQQSGVREGNTAYTGQQTANVTTQTKYGTQASAQSNGSSNQTMTVRNAPYSQTQSGTFGSALTWSPVTGCGQPSPCSGGSGLNNMSADTTGSINQNQNTTDPASTGNQTATINQNSRVGYNESSLSGTISQNTAAVVNRPTHHHWDPQQTQTITGETHSEGQIFVPITNVFAGINHFMQTITVTAQNILNF